VQSISSQHRGIVTKPENVASGSTRTRSGDKGAGSSHNPNLLWQSSLNPENNGEYEDEFSDESGNFDGEAGLSEDGSDTPHDMFSSDYKSDLNEVVILLPFHHFASND
jgi:hypothetical protein